MKITNLEDRVHVLDSDTDVMGVIRSIADSGVQEEAFYICDIGDIVKKHKIFKMAMPRVEPHYAVKCNDSLIVLRVLAALGTGFDCASRTEIKKVLSLGVTPDRIIFANPAKPSSHVKFASAVGVSTMTFDNESELHKISRFYPNAKLVLRIRCDAAVSQCPLGSKFGCNIESEAPHLMELARDLGLNLVGISFHVGSGCQDPPVFRRAITAARHLFDYGSKLGFNMNLLDIGGGYPGDKGKSIDKIAEVVNKALDDLFPKECGVHVIAEPGRYYVASSYTLACNIHSIRVVAGSIENNNPPHFMYYINDGVYGSFNCILYDHQVVTPQLLKPKYGKMYPSSIWGPTCDSLDKVIDSMLLPELDIGDWMVFENMGAYTLPVASPFNGFPIPKVQIVADESTWLFLKDCLPLSEDDFVMGTPPPMEMNDVEQNFLTDWSSMTPIDINLPMQIPLEITPMCHDRSMDGHVYSLVEIETLN